MQDFTDLQDAYPAWNIRRPEARSYLIATRRDRSHLSAAELGAGLAMTLIEDNRDDLAEALAVQRIIEEAR